jgi:hypothetical protein
MLIALMVFNINNDWELTVKNSIVILSIYKNA